MGIGVERVDFVSIPVRDRDRARRFYGDVLGLPPAGRRRTSSRPAT
jgi:catechol 2,3-dioxygenase-like lactoylglutathione lyase family enzyme